MTQPSTEPAAGGRSRHAGGRDRRGADGLGRTSTGPLAGVVIADFSRVLAGPYATMLLADMGATVIKVEGPDGDDTRTYMPPVRDGEATFFLAVNRNKHSIALDLKDPEDLDVARSLIRSADVMIENFKPGNMARLGLDYADAAELKPDIIYASITGFGTGAGAHIPGYDLLVQAASGMMSLTGDQDTQPYRAGIALFDVITGLHAAIGILGALHHKDQTGEGQLVELNLLTSALSGMVNQSAAYVTGGVVPTRMGNEHPSMYPYAPMQTGDGMIIIATGNDAQFVRLCGALAIPEVARDPKFATTLQRNAHRDELRDILHTRLAPQSAAQWFRELSAAGLPCAPIQDVRGGVDFAAQLGLQPVVLAGTGARKIPTVRHPVDYSRTPVDYALAPPELNESSELVRTWLAHQTTLAHA
ncbi:MULTISPECIES: CaiB/BaiF CoA transferase family protein [unclassified Arthrobacter]|uniref:CaiB/BaiF CoA transferase family protein n=1 Tax=unclassified Arthrobacter TaxID=235627 RepID=UPI002E0741FE|nr:MULTISPECIES: CoA transferase [unclassified Arthrobacter]MEC5193282.1 crotonobetainyl-CoA:carnitine CoA-transferase CaiB-like acyl-CoA transferase [Arthrobacter sp. MP_M4]MEC5204745.1 crotonobetainyl-CoA:carnitine CoA-transferase CaiB-like acyl-CoA transferase [Arthrobacter sp. MP_M7]